MTTILEPILALTAAMTLEEAEQNVEPLPSMPTLLQASQRVDALRHFLHVGYIHAPSMSTGVPFVARQVSVVAHVVDGEPLREWSNQLVPEEPMCHPSPSLKEDDPVSPRVDGSRPLRTSGHRIEKGESLDLAPRRVHDPRLSRGVAVLPSQVVVPPTQLVGHVVNRPFATVHRTGATRLGRASAAISDRRVHRLSAPRSQVVSLAQPQTSHRLLATVHRARCRLGWRRFVGRIAVSLPARIVPAAPTSTDDRAGASLDAARRSGHGVTLAGDVSIASTKGGA